LELDMYPDVPHILEIKVDALYKTQYHASISVFIIFGKKYI